ncbi:hypothetical protein KP509_34G021000 [Ceratopteris richardii]|uniref:Protein kinase domain-containing protein n=1 Tax=Ceratopteris richardii TaxID=49495 RepID=A0A8T2QJL6_CERRI|nr:hypothetical protein KP509_34G021000 [Ceratopteris richardii]KAH7283726.1 hypothetical protein KP509_34G021000 [Ceratopteris richardii]
MRSLVLLLVLVAGPLLPRGVECDLRSDKEALLRFLQGLAAAARVKNWSNDTSPCTWDGVQCNRAQDAVQVVQLPGSGLYGSIGPGTLGALAGLETLSLRSNRLSGRLPGDLANCTRLRKLYLQHNLLSGPIPSFRSDLNPALNVIDLSFNELTGPIPDSLSTLSLRILLLQNNSLSGPIPQDLIAYEQINLANNFLNGSVPPTLRNRPSSDFAGNAGLCGPPLTALCSVAPSPGPSPQLQEGGKSRRKLSILDIILVVVAGAAIFLLLGACCLLCMLRKQLMSVLSPTSKAGGAEGEAKAGTVDWAKSLDDSKDDFSSAKEPQHNKLVFFQGKQLSFDLEDLLRASAEVLGKGNLGTSYKAALEEGPTVVVKRLKEVSVGRKEFEQQLDFVGRLRQSHIVPLRAYYFSKEEKLLVYEYLPLGSLSAALHDGQNPLDWDMRLRIAMAAGKGVAQLHATGSRTAHGNIKSSNVLLHAEYDACLSDSAITPLFAANVVVGRTNGYRAPEVLETRKVSQASDVYSFGVVLLELLTGKAPWLMQAKQGLDLPRWVQSVVREEWTSEVFDKDLLRYQNIEEEMVHLLQIALVCVSPHPTQRPHIQDVLKMIASIRPNLLRIDSESSPSSTDPDVGPVQASQSNASPSPQQNSPQNITS